MKISWFEFKKRRRKHTNTLYSNDFDYLLYFESVDCGSENCLKQSNTRVESLHFLVNIFHSFFSFNPFAQMYIDSKHPDRQKVRKKEWNPIVILLPGICFGLEYFFFLGKFIKRANKDYTAIDFCCYCYCCRLLLTLKLCSILLKWHVTKPFIIGSYKAYRNKKNRM